MEVLQSFCVERQTRLYRNLCKLQVVEHISCVKNSLLADSAYRSMSTLTWKIKSSESFVPYLSRLAAVEYGSESDHKCDTRLSRFVWWSTTVRIWLHTDWCVKWLKTSTHGNITNLREKFRKIFEQLSVKTSQVIETSAGCFQSWHFLWQEIRKLDVFPQT